MPNKPVENVALKKAVDKNAESMRFAVVFDEKWSNFLIAEIDRVSEELIADGQKMKELEQMLEKRNSLDVRVSGEAMELLGMFDRNVGGRSPHIGARNLIISISRAAISVAKKKQEE
jgi:hypothetical protein